MKKVYEFYLQADMEKEGTYFLSLVKAVEYAISNTVKNFLVKCNNECEFKEEDISLEDLSIIQDTDKDTGLPVFYYMIKNNKNPYEEGFIIEHAIHE